MKIIITILMLTFSLNLLLPQAIAFAQEEELMEATSEAEIVEAVNSYELFWPLSAGKTVDDSLFFLKRFKENIRGLFIFSAPKKADYALFLATKRFIEAEKLLNEKKKDKALESMDLGIAKLTSAEKNWEKARNSDTPRVNEMEKVIPKIDNLNKLISYYEKNTDGDVKNKFSAVKTGLERLREKIQ